MNVSEIPKNERRTIYVTDAEGNLVRRVLALYFTRAKREHVKYHADWRRAFIEYKIENFDSIQTDDGYIIKVRKVVYATTKSYIDLDTGNWPMPQLYHHLETYEQMEHKLDSLLLTSAPQPSFYEEKNNDAFDSKKLHIMRAIVRTFFLNGYDLHAAVRKHVPKIKHRQTINVANSKLMGHVLMSESIKYFETAGVTPDKVIKGVHAAVEATGDAAMWMRWMQLYARLHPDLEDKKYNEIANKKFASNAPTGVFMGDQYVIPAPAQALPEANTQSLIKENTDGETKIENIENISGNAEFESESESDSGDARGHYEAGDGDSAGTGAGDAKPD